MLGEILITVGVIVMLYVVWQMWVGDIIYGAQNNAAGAELSEEWDARSTPCRRPADAAPDPRDRPRRAPGQAEPVVLAEPGDAEVFGIMRIPRFGADYAVQIAGGITRKGTLDTHRHRPLPGHRDAGRGRQLRPGRAPHDLRGTRSPGSPSCTWATPS